MIKLDPILAVADVNKSAAWFATVFGCVRKHEGDAFAVIEDSNGNILVCLHKWGEDDHPTMNDPSISPGNGLIFYFKTDDLEQIRRNVLEAGLSVEEELHVNPNSGMREFSLRDTDGYFWTVTEYHEYGG